MQHFQPSLELAEDFLLINTVQKAACVPPENGLAQALPPWNGRCRTHSPRMQTHRIGTSLTTTVPGLGSETHKSSPASPTAIGRPTRRACKEYATIRLVTNLHQLLTKPSHLQAQHLSEKLSSNTMPEAVVFSSPTRAETAQAHPSPVAANVVNTH